LWNLYRSHPSMKNSASTFSCPDHNGMHYLSRGSHWMQKHKFRVRCLGVYFVESTPSPPEHEKLCVDVSRPGHTRMQYVTHRLHWIGKHKSGITCPSTLFVKSVPVAPEHEKLCIDVFTAWSQWNALFDPHIPLDAKTQVWC
jgi:hypothetical protein